MKRSADVKASNRKRIRAFWVGIAGMYLFLFGIGACQHSRRETKAEAAQIVTRYHPWVAILGAIIAVVGFGIAQAEKKRFDSQD